MNTQHLFSLILILGFSVSGFAQVKNKESESLSEKIKKLQDWIAPANNGARDLYQDRWVASALLDLNANYDHPDVQNFIKGGTAIERMIQVCGPGCKHILLIGIASSDAKAAETSLRVLNEMKNMKLEDISKPASVAEGAYQNHRTSLEHVGDKRTLSEPQAVINSLKQSFSNLLSGEQFIINANNQYAYLRLRAKMESALSAVRTPPGLSEISILEKWFGEDFSFATPEQIAEALRSLGVSEEKIKELNEIRIREFSRKKSCEAFSLKKKDEASLLQPFVSSLEKNNGDWPKTTTDFAEQVQEFLDPLKSPKPKVINKIVSDWPKFIVQALGKNPSQSETTQLLRLIDIGSRLCKESQTLVENISPLPRTQIKYERGPCKQWSLLKNNITQIRAEAVLQQQYLDQLDTSKITPDNSFEDIVDKTDDIARLRKRLSKIQGDPSNKKIARMTEENLMDAEAELEELLSHLDPDQVSACSKKSLPTKTPSAKSNERTPRANGL